MKKSEISGNKTKTSVAQNRGPSSGYITWGRTYLSHVATKGFQYVVKRTNPSTNGVEATGKSAKAKNLNHRTIRNKLRRL